jgi:hypothetical protein
MPNIGPSLFHTRDNDGASQRPQFSTMKDEQKHTIYQQNGYQPDLSDLAEGSNLAGIIDKGDRLHHQQAMSPLAQHPKPYIRRIHPVRPIRSNRPQSSAFGTIASSRMSATEQHAFIPTPPGSPFLFTPSTASHAHIQTPQSHVQSSSSSAASGSRKMASSFGPPLGPGKAQVSGNSYLGSSLIQSLNFDDSPNNPGLSTDTVKDPFVDQIEHNIQGRQSATTGNAIMLHSPFQPSRALLDQPRVIAPQLALIAQHVGIDLHGNYKGDITKEHIYNAIAPISDNCALHIIGLPADITLREVFSEIVGKVFSFQLHAPVPGKWTGCGARLVFANRATAENFFCKARTGPGIIVRGHQIRVLWNRDPCRPQHYADRHQSRVLQIKGPNTPQFSAETVERFFATNLLFTLVDRKEWVEAGGVKVVELHFPSILGQSRPAMKQFYEMLDETDQRSIFKIQYAPDPCEAAFPSTISWPDFHFPSPLVQ